MKNLFIVLLLIVSTIKINAQTNDTYTVVIDGEEVLINGTTGEIVSDSRTINTIETQNDLTDGNFKSSKELYKIKSGDTFYNIAKRNNTTVERLKQINGFKSDHILLKGTSIFVEKRRKVITANSKSHTVKPGDTLYSIAKRYGSSVEHIQKLNRLNSNAIFVNQKLRVK